MADDDDGDHHPFDDDNDNDNCISTMTGAQHHLAPSSIASTSNYRSSLLAGVSALVASMYRLAQTGGTLNSWLTLTLVTWLLDKIRRRLHTVNPFKTLAKQFYFDSIHDDEDVSFDWIREYLENQPRYLYSKNAYSTSTGVRETYGAAKKLLVQSDDQEVMAVQDEVQPNFQPWFTKTYWFIYRRTLFRIARGTVQSRTYRGVTYTAPITYGSLNIRCFTKDKTVLLFFLAEAKKLFEATRPPQVALHSFNGGRADFWDAGQLRQKRGWDSIVLDDEVKSALRSSVKDFLDSKLWYGSKGLNWTMGIMLYGPPGTGKTTSVVGLASEFDLPVYSIPLNSPRLHDDTLTTAIRSIAAQRCIVLLEDVGAWYAAFKRSQRGGRRPSHRVRSAAAGGIRGREEATGSDEDSGGDNPAGQEGQDDDDADDDGDGGERYGNPASGGNRISLSALLNHLDGVANTEGVITILTTNHLEGIDEALMRPGRVDLRLYFGRATKKQAESLFRAFYALPAEGDNKTPVMHNLTEDRIESLASLWTATFEDEEFSHAALQGYLLNYKRSPQEAVNNVSAWVEEARDKKRLRNKKKRQSAAHPKPHPIRSISPPPASYELPASPATSRTELTNSTGSNSTSLNFEKVKQAESPPTTEAFEEGASVSSFQTADNTVVVNA